MHAEKSKPKKVHLGVPKEIIITYILIGVMRK
jgi:hypothetical protein